MTIRRRITLPQAAKRPFRVLLLLLGLCLVCRIGWSLFWQLAFGMPGYLDFTLHRGEYERIVRDAKAMPMTPGASPETTLEGQDVTVERDSKGQFVVIIQTLDWDHAGSYGYVYSDVPLDPSLDGSEPQETDLPISNELNEISQRINAHWWSVYNGRN